MQTRPSLPLLTVGKVLVGCGLTTSFVVCVLVYGMCTASNAFLYQVSAWLHALCHVNFISPVCKL